MSRTPIRAAIMQYFEQRPGVNVYLKDLMVDLGEKDAKRVQTGITNLSRETGFPIEIVQRGQIYRYSPFAIGGKEAKDARRSGRIFEEIGQSKKDGSLILESEDGTLYRATEL